MHNNKKIIIQVASIVFIISLVFGLLTVYQSQSYDESNNEIKFSEISNDPFKQVPAALVDYNSSKDYIDDVLTSVDLGKKEQNIIGLIEDKENNIILVESDGNIIEIISDNEKNIIATRNQELKVIQTKEFTNKSGALNEKTTIQLCELELHLTESNGSYSVNAIKIIHENWEDSFLHLSHQSKYVHLSGIYLIDIDDNVIASGKTNALENSPILSTQSSRTHIQNQKVVAVLSNSATWKSKGFGITSKSTRETQVSFDRLLNIEIWVAGDSWIGF
ncbi:hypothetical protein SAMN04488589_2442 [Methanolobus vulcani]|uniref:Uncharacterized protein n=1 Tax=Methanolobus vulcani TaxID=38026 RepID=A0A7Z7B0X2_9EURY|nr:hypothetical protein [Methanolobus vulcani]SDG21647.1 hypothetical protein SAMN04488589_2442 [Methanolobus vulcani]